jgi:hypothetical protein
MSMGMTIEEFDKALRTTKKDDTPLLKALRKLTAVKEPKEILAATSGEEILRGWG